MAEANPAPVALVVQAASTVTFHFVSRPTEREAMMLIASTPHPRAPEPMNVADLGKPVSMRKALAMLRQRRPHAVSLPKRRA